MCSLLYPDLLDEFYGTKSRIVMKSKSTDDYDDVFYPAKFIHPPKEIHTYEQTMRNLNTKLPVITFSLNSNEDEISHEQIKLGSIFCPNYIFISASLARIKSFITTHQNYYLSRKNARYALIVNNDSGALKEFNSTSFLDNIKFFKKVLNLAVFLFSKTNVKNADSEQINSLEEPQISSSSDR